MPSPSVSAPLALDMATFRRLGQQVVELAAQHLEGLPAAPVFQRMSEAERLALIESALPAAGLAPDAILGQLADAVLPHPMGNGHPRFFGWVNSPPAPLAVLTELLAAAMNPSCAGGDHAAIYLEHAVLRWLGELAGLPWGEHSGGLLVSGGSMASLTALAAARDAACRQDGWDLRTEGLAGGPKLALYLSEEGHSCVRKAAELLGIGSKQVRTVPIDSDFRMDVAQLAAMIQQDRHAGLRPFCVVGSAGAVSTGAIDPLDRLADLCATEHLWFHVDGAYGAVGAADAQAAALYAGLDRVDSLALDPHKWLSVPVECGAVLVKDKRQLRDAFSLVPSYLRQDAGKGFANLPWFSEYGFQQTRGFRALKLWVVLAQAGRDGIAARIAADRALAQRLAAAIDAAPDLERLAPVPLSIVCFRYHPAGTRLAAEALDALNKAIMERLQEQGEVFVTNAQVRGRFALRACFINFRTTPADVDTLVRCVREAGLALAAGG